MIQIPNSHSFSIYSIKLIALDETLQSAYSATKPALKLSL